MQWTPATFGFLGYAIAALAYLVLAGLVGAARRGDSRVGRLLIGAALVEAVWAVAMALVVTTLRLPGVAAGASEALRTAAWSVFVILVASGQLGTAGTVAAGPGGVATTPIAPDEAASARRRLRALGIGIALALAAGSITADLLEMGQQTSFGARLLAAIFGVVCVEQLYRNAPHTLRWHLKYLALALVGLFGFDIVLYSDALLFGRLDPGLWIARGYANLLIVPLVFVAAARARDWKLNLHVSRQVVFHTTALLGAGAYLLAIAAIGYWVKLVGGEWGNALLTLVAFGALLALLLFALSGNTRAKLRVFVAKNFFAYRFDYRQEWLRFTERMSQPAPPELGDSVLPIRTVESMAQLAETRGGALWLRDEHGDYVQAAHASFPEDLGAMPGSASLVRFLTERDWVIDVAEYRVDRSADRSLYGDLILPDWCRAENEVVLIVPLRLHGELLGFVALARPRVAIDLDWELRDLLKAVATQAASYLAQREAVRALVQARQFESFNRMSAFVVHDLKNLVAQLSLMTANAARHRDNPEFQADMLATVENVLARMRGLLLQLRAGTRPIEQAGPLALGTTVRAAIAAKPGLEPAPSVNISEAAEKAVVRGHDDRLQRVIGHLVQNAAEATPASGRIGVTVDADERNATITVQDTGKGMSAEFIRERLFRPFESTKAQGMGIGTFESREYVRELGGALEVESREGEGTTFRIRLPLAGGAGAPDGAGRTGGTGRASGEPGSPEAAA